STARTDGRATQGDTPAGPVTSMFAGALLTVPAFAGVHAAVTRTMRRHPVAGRALARPDPAVGTEYKAYLPDFCSAGTIFVVLLVAELVAIALTLAAVPAPGQFLVELGETSLFALWFALLASAILCRMRGRVER